MSVVLESWAWGQEVGSPIRKLILVKLAQNADDEGWSWWRQRRMAAECEVSRSTLQEHLKALREAGLIEVHASTREDGGRGSNRYRVLRAIRAGVTGSRAGVAREAGSKNLSVEERPLVKEEVLEELELQEPLFSELLPSRDLHRDDRERIQQEWLAARIVAHRDGYFADSAVKKKLDRAIDRYGATDVCAAIRAYSEVLSSPDHYWTHRWTLADFLCRGLDKFVAEARPLENFRACTNGSDPPEPTYPRLPPGETY